ncbi:hypothetical protein [Fimbriimonas ginsengisoli]|uniref:Uncharacterized protein n=1 Tax=Fimbriimonas ginsengisoli Gsoil 348 TaxID=661478 RepID=A0A068NRD4_FIMGI|nr:hypothetical protein OP10G_2628 [Fimbriimonas ginsengisoli Gsoil 348]
MASSKPTITVTLSRDAEDDLIGIWADNVELYKDVDHADGYLHFLRTGINRLATSYAEGQSWKGSPSFGS